MYSNNLRALSEKQACQSGTRGPVSADEGGAEILVSDFEPIVSFRPRQAGTRPEPKVTSPPVKRTAFDRTELHIILNLYGSKVAEGEWRDYALDFGSDTATFSIYRRASEMPLYRIVKEATLARRQGAYAVIAQGGLILRRGHDLAHVLRVLLGKPKLVTI
jgi:hypothetical protein